MSVLNPDPMSLPQADFERWLVEHQKSLGCSDIGAIIGVSAFKSAADVWDQIMDRVPRGEDNSNMARGRALEPIVATEYARATDRTLRTKASSRIGDFARVSVDRIIMPTTAHRGKGVLEIKVPGSHNYGNMRLHGVDAMYHAQLQWYMGWLRFHWGAFAIFNADTWQLFHHDVDADGAMFARMVDAATTFWHDNVLGRRRPGANAPDAEAGNPLHVSVPTVGAEATDLSQDAEFVAAVSRLKEVRERAAMVKREEELATERVQEIMAARTADIATCGLGTIRWNNIPSTRFDQTSFRREHAELYAQYTRSIMTRPFRPSFGRE